MFSVIALFLAIEVGAPKGYDKLHNGAEYEELTKDGSFRFSDDGGHNVATFTLSKEYRKVARNNGPRDGHVKIHFPKYGVHCEKEDGRFTSEQINAYEGYEKVTFRGDCVEKALKKKFFSTAKGNLQLTATVKMDVETDILTMRVKLGRRVTKGQEFSTVGKYTIENLQFQGPNPCADKSDDESSENDDKGPSPVSDDESSENDDKGPSPVSICAQDHKICAQMPFSEPNYKCIPRPI